MKREEEGVYEKEGEKKTGISWRDTEKYWNATGLGINILPKRRLLKACY